MVKKFFSMKSVANEWEILEPVFSAFFLTLFLTPYHRENYTERCFFWLLFLSYFWHFFEHFLTSVFHTPIFRSFFGHFFWSFFWAFFRPFFDTNHEIISLKTWFFALILGPLFLAFFCQIFLEFSLWWNFKDFFVNFTILILYAK